MGICFIQENKYENNEKPSKKEIEVGDHKNKAPTAEISERDPLYNSIVRINFVLNEENFIGTGFFIK